MPEATYCQDCNSWLRKWTNVCEMTSVKNGEVKRTPYLSSKTYPTGWGKCDLGQPTNTRDVCPACERWKEIDAYRKDDRYEVYETSLIAERQ